MDRLIITQRIKIIKSYYKNGDGRWTAIVQTTFSSANPQVIEERPLHLKKSPFGALFGPNM